MSEVEGARTAPPTSFFSKMPATWSTRLPTFSSPSDVTPEWSRYLERVYKGPLPANAFPLNLKTFELFYVDLLPVEEQPFVQLRPLLGEANKTNTSRFSKALRRVPTGNNWRKKLLRRQGDVYSLWPSIDNLAFVYQYDVRGKWVASPSGYPSHSIVEVMHCYEDADNFYWMYSAKGSGVSFDVGNTIVARNAFELWRMANLSITESLSRMSRRCRPLPPNGKIKATIGFYCGSPKEEMHQSYRLTRQALAVLLQRGVDSVQLIRTEEHGIFKFELIDLRPHRRVLHCYDGRFHERKSTTKGCSYGRGPASDEETWSATPQASSCPTDGAPGKGVWVTPSFRSGWAGRNECRCPLSRPRDRCLRCV